MNQHAKFFVLIFLMLFATIQYVLILRHKAPNVSDSYFYKHTYYQLQGDTFHQAYQKNLQNIDFEKADIITTNIFKNPQNYNKSYKFFAGRTLYPYLAYWLNLIFDSEYLAFLIPIFISYIGTILLTFYICAKGLNYFFASFATALLIAFYPFLDWSTFFLTDVIGTFLWLLLIFFAFQYINFKKNVFLIFFALTLLLSLFNREQAVLTVPLFLLFFLMVKIFKFSKIIISNSFKILLVTIVIVFPYLLFTTLRFRGSIVENLEYMRNSFGLYSNAFTMQDNISYIIKSLKITHLALLLDLLRHHWWFVFTFMGLLSQALLLFFTKKRALIDLLLLSSFVASYMFIIWPFLSYRFLFPAIISIIYFSSKFMQEIYDRLEDQ